MADDTQVLDVSLFAGAPRLDEITWAETYTVKRLALWVFSRIAQALARRAALIFGMHVLDHNRHAVNFTQNAHELLSKVTPAAMDDLLQRAVIIAVVLPLPTEARHPVELMATSNLRLALSGKLSLTVFFAQKM